MLILYLPQLFVQSDFNVTITPQTMQVIIRKTGELIIALANYADVFGFNRRFAFSVPHKKPILPEKANKYSSFQKFFRQFFCMLVVPMILILISLYKFDVFIQYCQFDISNILFIIRFLMKSLIHAIHK